MLTANYLPYINISKYTHAYVLRNSKVRNHMIVLERNKCPDLSQRVGLIDYYTDILVASKQILFKCKFNLKPIYLYYIYRNQ